MGDETKRNQPTHVYLENGLLKRRLVLLWEDLDQPVVTPEKKAR